MFPALMKEAGALTTWIHRNYGEPRPLFLIVGGSQKHQSGWKAICLENQKLGININICFDQL